MYYSESRRQDRNGNPNGPLYHQSPKANPWSLTSSTSRSTSLGSLTKNGVSHTVILSWLPFHPEYNLIASLFDVAYFNVSGQQFLFLGSLRRITDLFKKKSSSSYSDRLWLPMSTDFYVSDSSHLAKFIKKSARCRMKWDFVTPSLFMASSNNGKLNPDVLDADCGIWFLVFGFRRRSTDPIFYWRKSHGAASPLLVHYCCKNSHLNASAD